MTNIDNIGKFNVPYPKSLVEILIATETLPKAHVFIFILLGNN